MVEARASRGSLTGEDGVGAKPRRAEGPPAGHDEPDWIDILEVMVGKPGAYARRVNVREIKHGRHRRQSSILAPSLASSLPVE